MKSILNSNSHLLEHPINHSTNSELTTTSAFQELKKASKEFHQIKLNLQDFLISPMKFHHSDPLIHSSQWVLITYIRCELPRPSWRR